MQQEEEKYAENVRRKEDTALGSAQERQIDNEL